MSTPWEKVGADTPLGKMLKDLYNPKKNVAVFHNLKDLRPPPGTVRPEKRGWHPVSEANLASDPSKPKGPDPLKTKVKVPVFRSTAGGSDADIFASAAAYRPSIRTKDQILKDNPDAYEPERYRPMPLAKVDKNGRRVIAGGEAEKQRLQKAVARKGKEAAGLGGGEEDDEDNPNGGARARRKEEQAAAQRRENANPEVELTKQLLREIKEREEFLEDMRRLGQEKEVEKPIKAEIAERVRRLRELEKAAAARPSDEN